MPFRDRIPSLVFLLGLALVLPQAKASPPRLKHALVVVLDTANYADAIKQPFLGKLARSGATLTNFFAETKTAAQPNYLAMIAADTMAVTDDAPHNVSGKQLATLVEYVGKHWKVYLEGWPGNCFRGPRQGLYVRKHNPFISFTEVQNGPRCQRNLVEARELDQDIDHQTLPDFAVYIPDLNNGGEATNLAYADKALQSRFEKLLGDSHFADVTLFVTFARGAAAGTNQIYTVVTGYGVRPGSISSVRYDHYSLVRTLELGLVTGLLGRNDNTARPFDGIWK